MKQVNKNRDYYIFDVDGFFRDFRRNKRKLKDLEWEKAQAITEGGMDYSQPKVSGGLPSSSVERKAEKIMAYDKQIEALKSYFEEADRLLSVLTKEEREIAEVYFVQGRKSLFSIDEMSQRRNLSRATIYRIIKRIRGKIRQAKGD